MCREIKCNEATQGVPQHNGPLQAPGVDQLRQVIGVDSHAIAMIRLVTVTTPTKIVGNDAMVTRQIIGNRLEAEGIGGDTTHADNRQSPLTPLHRMKCELSRGNEFISHWTQDHGVLLGEGILSMSAVCS